MSKPTVRDHAHGTYLCYLHDGCHCRPCTTAWNVYQQQLKSRHRRGEVWCDPDEYQQLLAPFVKAGVTPTALGRATGVRPATARSLMDGRRVRVEYAAKVDDVTWDDIDDRALVNADLFRAPYLDLVGGGLTSHEVATGVLGWGAWPGGDYPTGKVVLRSVRLLERAAGRTDHGAPEDPRCVECGEAAWCGGLRCRGCFRRLTLPPTRSELDVVLRREADRERQRRLRAGRRAAA